jgi:serine/threonine-protein kinase RIO1
MKTPNRIVPLIEDGVIDEVLQQLMSGKEATVYVVRCGREIRCAKVYKEVAKRSFKQAVQYKEGRKAVTVVVSGRSTRAPNMAENSRKQSGTTRRSMRYIS